MLVQSVNVLVRGRDGRTLLQFRDTATRQFPLAWGLWGGAMAEEDESPAHCAAREICEELMLDAAPAQFVQIGERTSSKGAAVLMLYGPPVDWGAFRVGEGAGAGFFWRSEILRLPMSMPLADHLRTEPQLFVESPGRKDLSGSP